MKNIKKLVITLLLGALMLSVFAFTGCKASQEETSNDNVDVGLAVLASYEETTATGENCLVKELIATVSGDNITSLELEWSIAWEQTNDEDINNYLVLEPSAFNEESKTSTCKIKLLAPLPYTAIVYVNCKNNDLTAKCFVNYSPSTHSISVDVSSLNVVQDSYYNADINILIEGTSYGFDISSLGFFGEEVSLEDIEIECSTIGEFYLTGDASLLHDGSDIIQRQFNLYNFINPKGDYDSFNPQGTTLGYADVYKPYLSYSTENDKLNINAINSVNNLASKDWFSMGVYINEYNFDSIIGDGEPYVTLTLRNTANNASVSYNFRVYPKLSISLDKNYITFS